MTRKRLDYNVSLCAGCLACVTNCSQLHRGAIDLYNSRIKIEIDPFSGSHKGIICRQCEDAECARVCPQEAIIFKDDGGYWLIDETKCNGCGVCVPACPYGAIFIDEEKSKAVKCDLCGGEPLCVSYCFTTALTLINEE